MTYRKEKLVEKTLFWTVQTKRARSKQGKEHGAHRSYWPTEDKRAWKTLPSSLSATPNRAKIGTLASTGSSRAHMTPTVTSPGRGARATATGARRRGDARSAEPDAAAGDCFCWDSLMPELSVAGSLRWLGAPESSTLNSSKKLVTDSECQHFTSVEFWLTRTESWSCPASH